ncbi:MAG: GAF domain-containing protein [Pseudomonadota bacterium]
MATVVEANEDVSDRAARLAALAAYGILDTPPEQAFDDIAELAAALCETPVALVSLVDSDRQWFKARVGFEPCETDLDSSVCKYALSESDLLIIPDLTRDPRTAGNRLVTGDPAIRFYAGAPLRTADGVTIGSLCVIDTVPRPAGLSERQRDGLRALGRHVMATLELRRLVAERDTALDDGRAREGALMSSEAHWRSLFEKFSEAFVIGEVVRDAAGVATDWRFLIANRAWAEMAGRDPSALAGKTMREAFPYIDEGWIADFAAAVDSNTAISFSRGSANGQRWLEGRCFPVGNDRFAAIFIDVTRRIAAERRQAALVTIGDRLRDLDRIDDMTRAASQIVGETLGGIRAGYGRLDHTLGTITVEPDWTAPDVASISGVHRYADYGDLLNELLVGEPLIIGDVRTDPRTAADPAPMLAQGVASQLQMPVRDRGRSIAVFFVHAGEPRRWRDDEIGFLRAVADRLEVAIARLEHDARRTIQAQELSHRLKNTLAMVQAIASQSLKNADDRPAVDAFQKRLSALATGHDVLLRSDWQDAPLIDVIGSALGAAGQEDRISLAGPPVDLIARAVLSVSLIIHELTTNALKYGALSVPDGAIDVVWQVRRSDGRETLRLRWTERDGPPVVEPTRRGFGSRLINMGLGGTGGVDLSYASTGLVATLSAPLDDLTQ